MGPGWESKRMKAIRFGLIHLPAGVLHHSRQWIIRLGKSCVAYRVLLEARQKILELASIPTG
jgi:hypothetical protein